MNSKCEWKKELVDGAPGKYVKVGFRFYPCGGFNPSATGTEYKCYCKECGEPIDKPEPVKPLIIKSGGTWVAHFEGVDYLWIGDGNMPQVRDQDMGDHFMRYITIKGFTNRWKPFSEITLDDEIAKLRVMVRIITDDSISSLQKLIYVESSMYTVVMNGMTLVQWKHKSKVRLATPKELQELSK